MLDCATDKVIPVVEGLIEEYELDPDQCLLIGEGGGAAALIPYVSERIGLRHEISKDAEVISSIGVALALVRDVVERVIPHPKPEDLQAIRREALEAAVRLGADAKSVEVTIEIDRQTHRVRATAMGAAEMHVKDPRRLDLRARGAQHRSPLHGCSSPIRCDWRRKRQVCASIGAGEGLGAVRAVDWEGAIRVRRSRALVSRSRRGRGRTSSTYGPGRRIRTGGRQQCLACF